jgi:hypothetical protein
MLGVGKFCGRRGVYYAGMQDREAFGVIVQADMSRGSDIKISGGGGFVW